MMEHWAEPLFPRPEELGIYADLAQTLGSGEAACLALALQRGWLVACDERRAFLREARNRLGDGRILNTAGIYVLSVRQGLLTVEQGTPRSTASREHREASDSGPLPRVSTTGQTTAVQNGSGS